MDRRLSLKWTLRGPFFIKFDGKKLCEANVLSQDDFQSFMVCVYSTFSEVKNCCIGQDLEGIEIMLQAKTGSSW
jgi:hypothetical protein